MKYVAVTFKNKNGFSAKRYVYKTSLNLMKGSIGEIVVDGRTTYSSPVKIEVIKNPEEVDSGRFSFEIRTITDFKLLQAPHRPESTIRNVMFNKIKGVTTVVWKDGTTTMVKQHPEDDWDKEKALAMCFMKRFYDNRSCFNEELKKWCDDARYEIKGE